MPTDVTSPKPPVQPTASGTAGTGAPTNPPEGGVTASDYATLKQGYDEMKARLDSMPTSSPETLAQDVAEHLMKSGRFKQSMSDMTKMHVLTRSQEIARELVAQIDALEQAGVITDANAAEKQRRSAQARAEELAQAEMASQTIQEQGQGGDEALRAEADQLLADLGLTWGDFPEWQGRRSVRITDIRRLAPKRAAEKMAANNLAQQIPTLETTIRKRIEDEIAQGKLSLQGATDGTPAPSGVSATEMEKWQVEMDALNTQYKDSGKPGEYLVRRRELMARKPKE